MRRRRPRRALAAFASLTACAVALSGCGTAGSSRSPSIAQLPLVSGARVVVQTRQCDRGANAYCAVQAVIVDPQARSSGALVTSERRFLRKLGWKGSAGDDGDERAADSPGLKLRVTYATGPDDLLGIDERWIKRPRRIALTLSRLMFTGTPSMSVMLETGSA